LNMHTVRHFEVNCRISQCCPRKNGVLVMKEIMGFSITILGILLKETNYEKSTLN